MEIWLNGCRLTRLEAAQLSRQKGSTKLAKAKIPAQTMQHDGNRVFAVAAIDVGRAAKVYNRRRLTLPNAAATAAPPARRLHYLGVGVTELTPGVGLAPLRYAGNDVVELEQALKRLASAEAPLSVGSFTTLSASGADDVPTEKNILQALERLSAVARPDDLVVVLFAGHGVSTAQGFRFVAQDTQRPETSGISDQVVTEHFARLPCRSLLLLDTCHAEGVQRQQNLQDWPGLGLGAQILASCDASQESFEHANLQLPGGLKGHGLFTAALLEALTGARLQIPAKDTAPADLDADGRLTIDEWCRYARLRTETLSRPDLPFLPAGKKPQTPKLFPSLSFPDSKQFALGPSR
jgi:uncharacterized caspase-like protein